MQRAQKADPVIAHSGVLVYHHDLVEKRVYRRLQGGERLERARVVERAVCLVDTRTQLTERGRQDFLLRQHHKGWIKVAWHGLGLLQDVSDALVRGGEAFGFWKAREGAHGLELSGNEVETGGVQAKNGFDFIGGIAGFQEVSARTIEYERLQIGVCVADSGLACETLKRTIDQVKQRDFELSLNEDANNPECRAAQAERVL